VEYLSTIVEDEHFSERNRDMASPQLRRYVTLLRKIEMEPSLAPETLGAIRSLERMRRRHAFTMLTESRKALKLNATSDQQMKLETKPATKLTVRPPITDLLKDIYQDDQSPTN
jgi:hypothetical protein